MNTVKSMMKLVAFCCICTVGSTAEEAGEPGEGKDAAVRIEITRLDVNDSTLVLRYTIRNETEREAWVCSKISSVPFEAFLTGDKKTLLIRKRLDVPSSKIWRGPPAPATYVRLSAGGCLADSVEMAVPVSPIFFYASSDKTEAAQTVGRLALEIGYYNRDLPALIHSIFDVVAKSGLTSRDIPSSILETYFKGFRVRGALSSFDVINTDPYGQGYAYVDYSYQALTDEEILRVDVNNVSIPYKGYIEVD